DRRWLVTNEDGELHLWDLASEQGTGREPTGSPVMPRRWNLLKGLGNPVFSSDSSWLLTAGKDEIQLNPLKSPDGDAGPEKQPKYRLGDSSSDGRIRAAAVSREGRWLALTRQAQTTRVWDLEQGGDKKPRVLTNVGLLDLTELFISPGASGVFAVD